MTSPARQAAQLYLVHQHHAQHGYFECVFGAASEDSGPLAFIELWPVVERRVRDGDRYAAAILRNWGRSCDRYRELGVDGYGKMFGLLVDEQLKGLDPTSAEYVAAAIHGLVQEQLPNLAQCTAQTSVARVDLLVSERAERLGIDPAVVELARAAGSYDNVAGLFDDKASNQQTCNDRFVEPNYWRREAFAGADSAWRWRTLLAAADPHSDLALALTTCIDAGCASLAAIPVEFQDALHELMTRLGSARDLADTTRHAPDPTPPEEQYQLDLYARWLTQAGCGMGDSPDVYAQLTLRLIAAGEKLTPDQRAAATAGARALIQRYGSAALALRGCATSNGS